MTYEFYDSQGRVTEIPDEDLEHALEQMFYAGGNSRERSRAIAAEIARNLRGDTLQ